MNCDSWCGTANQPIYFAIWFFKWLSIPTGLIISYFFPINFNPFFENLFANARPPIFQPVLLTFPEFILMQIQLSGIIFIIIGIGFWIGILLPKILKRKKAMK